MAEVTFTNTGCLYIIVRAGLLAVLWAATLKYVEILEYSNVLIDWDACLALPRPTKPGSRRAAALVWAVEVALLVELAIRWEEFYLWPEAALLATAVVLSIPSYYVAYEDIVRRQHSECLIRSQKTLDWIRDTRKEEQRRKDFNTKFNHDLSRDPLFPK